MMRFFDKLSEDIDKTLKDKSQKLKHDARLFYITSSIIFVVMIGINLVKRQYAMGIAVVIILTIALTSLEMSRHERTFYASLYVFSLSLLFFFIYLCISPTGGGFNMLWTLMVPAYGMLFYGRRIGTIFSLAILCIILFIFYSPLGISLTSEIYTRDFKFRFPLLYVSFTGCSIYSETISKRTRKKLQEMIEKHDYMSKHDLLTDIMNRQEFIDKAGKLVEGGESSSALLMVSIDDLQGINKAHGNEKGDEVLKRVAELVSKQVGEKGFAARWGGGDFAAFLHDWKDCGAVSETICSKVRGLCAKDAGLPPVTVSVGAYAECGEEKLSLDEFLERTSGCLRRAKEKGKDRAEIEIDDAPRM